MELRRIRGITLPHNSGQMTMRLFADDTNAFVHNEDTNWETFWWYLDTFCEAFGSRINHSKTTFRAIKENQPNLLTVHGCQNIQSGQVVCIFGIPMGLGVTLEQRWA
ncbi:hypothetical protein KP509_05G026800 [Ceratopteris richardii]|uniref:Reverse transcriptase domain-containing protein n=1 Tax=Ceratopteris richardii TaxID=49495 RepID=A0A8T2USL3_CERRI|nr:hypothetical protein KP509_05G026800 [Ceratopteris richardii]